MNASYCSAGPAVGVPPHALSASRSSPIWTRAQRCFPAPQPCRRWHVRTGARKQEDEAVGVGGLDPSLEVAVPKEQRPVNELKQIKQAQLYSWATLETPDYVTRLIMLFGAFFAVVGGPIAYQTFDPTDQPIEFILSATTGSLVVVAVAVIRIFLGWQYVGNRLLSAAVEYEETGWYDGQVFVKPPEVLMRDRLLGTYEVKPVLQKLRSTLLGAGGLLLTSAVSLFVLIKSGADVDGVYGRGSYRAPRQISDSGIVFSSRVSDVSQLADDDELAEAEAQAQGNIPGYCSDPAYKAYAGGQYCPSK